MNKPNFLKLLPALFLLFTLNVNLHSQNFDTQLNFSDTAQVHLVFLNNGKKLKGRIIEIENNDVFFFHKKTRKNDTLNLSNIAEIKVQGHLDGWEKDYDTPTQYSQYLFHTNTAFGLKYKDRNYRTFMGASMLLDYGLADGVSIGVGYSFPLLLSANIKFSKKVAPKTRAAYKSLVLTIPVLAFSNENFTVFENSMTMTFGKPNLFLNFSYSNYYISTDRNFFFRAFDFPTIYNSFSIGTGIRLNERWQFIMENHINFNTTFLDAKILPSFGFSYTNNLHNIAFGFNSLNQLGFNTLPIIDFNDDEVAIFTSSFVSRLPYFTYSKLF